MTANTRRRWDISWEPLPLWKVGLWWSLFPQHGWVPPLRIAQLGPLRLRVWRHAELAYKRWFRFEGLW